MRGLILSAIAENEPISVTDLSKKLNISMGTTIYRYLEELKQRGLITMKQEKNKRGKPTMLSTTSKAKPFKFKSMDNTIKALDKFNKFMKG